MTLFVSFAACGGPGGPVLIHDCLHCSLGFTSSSLPIFLKEENTR